MGTKMAVSFANIFMAEVEREIINRSHFKPLTWKRYIDDVFSLWNINKEEINSFIKLANSYHPTKNFTAEISDKEIPFLDTCLYKCERFKKESILDVRTHFRANRQKLSNIHISPPATLQASAGKPASFVNSHWSILVSSHLHHNVIERGSKAISG